MHRSRAKLLQPLEGQLSQQHYPGLSRSISLELGNIFREIGDIKAAAGREPDKVRAAGPCQHGWSSSCTAMLAHTVFAATHKQQQ
jgi:hypothetical protein